MTKPEDHHRMGDMVPHNSKLPSLIALLVCAICFYLAHGGLQ